MIVRHHALPFAKLASNANSTASSVTSFHMVELRLASHKHSHKHTHRMYRFFRMVPRMLQLFSLHLSFASFFRNKNTPFAVCFTRGDAHDAL